MDLASELLVSIPLLTYWSKVSDDEQVIAVMRDALEEIGTVAKARNTLVPFKFMNYAFSF